MNRPSLELYCTVGDSTGWSANRWRTQACRGVWVQELLGSQGINLLTLSHNRLRFGCLCGPFKPSRRQMRSTLP